MEAIKEKLHDEKLRPGFRKEEVTIDWERDVCMYVCRNKIQILIFPSVALCVGLVPIRIGFCHYAESEPRTKM